MKKSKKWLVLIMIAGMFLPVLFNQPVVYGAVSSEVGIIFEGQETEKKTPKPTPAIKEPPKKYLPKTSETRHSSLNLIGLLLILGVTLYSIKLRLKKQIN